MNRLADVEQMTLTEFHYKRYAREYKEIDEEYRMHKLAFLTRNASVTENTGTDKKPKEEYVFKNFKDFFDYEKALESVDQEIKEEKKKESPNKKLSPAQLALRHNSRKE
ncbi:hypothetical protein [Aquibacillus rhizosphaerae]|uniref:Phage protein n=1 Tax=Aquibacillus rhizosphaerae TaxID=3051431 RepID=A0ABT7LBP0_9BACI|nr:hypothetical protein [Aquibacillus sp. LR5S19]MDL4842839.1 hypothetical protein [Aquibacillus sp. LR5S19]